ncbi:MAG: phosphatase PAP2 family protein [Oscillibacter sp.]|nr:phosphatase PAP2 family protein [Oscillibacter sp.]
MELELAILDWIQLHLRCGFLDWLMPFVSGLSNHGEVWILFAALLLLIRRAYGLSAAGALALDLIACNMILKPLIGRIRPFAFRPELPLLVSPPGDASFPSGHTAAAFAVVFALKTAGSSLWRPALVLAAVTAFSRLYLYVHWPTDVLGGILLGAAVGWAGAKLAGEFLKKRETG